uniref:Uncharacterized protein n=1 Tax=Arundo donax TaxID=35708 RepID=A0A0A9DQZ4_ARUDO
MNELCDLKVHINGHHTLHLHQARTTCQILLHQFLTRLRSRNRLLLLFWRSELIPPSVQCNRASCVPSRGG